ncbi:DUF892 family protein [Defluviimonas sp. WL0002]|uniref:DUF892 family protein n=1 Tax=Albidovulum marisflavi TaxID=2984159 RepID=A0ABT2ZD72_9RHOB|nr:DUF892 family protein [Defluviimonas sp. WL0002]MCV2869090.1 DUF892 family protein [Defluviimonas sp. WL0002]
MAAAAEKATMEGLFLHWLNSIYHAEHRLAEALPQLAERASAGPLEQGLRTQLQEVKGQIERLQRIYEMIGETPSQGTCAAMDEIVGEMQRVVPDEAEDDLRDAALVAVMKTAKSYEIARYSTLLAWAKELAREDCVDLLEQTLDEEQMEAEMFTKASEERLNRRA